MENKVRLILEGNEIELTPGQTVQLTWNSAAFDDELKESTFSVPLKAPLTAANRLALGQPQLLESNFDYDLQREGNIDAGGLLIPCRVQVKRVAGQVAELQCYATSSGVADQLREKKLNTLPIGRSAYWSGIPDPSSSTLTFYNTSMQVFLSNMNDDEVDGVLWPSYETEALDPRATYYVNKYEPALGEYVLTGANNRTSPAVRVKRVMEEIFKYLGYEYIDEAFALDADLRKAFVWNNKWLPYRSGLSGAGYVDMDFPIEEHLPEMPIGDFLKSVCKFFFLCIFWDLSEKRVRVVKLANLATTGAAVDWTDKMSREVEITADAPRGWRLMYVHDDQDEVTSNFLKDFRNLRKGTAVTKLSDLPLPPSVVPNLRYVARENGFYQYNNATDGWQLYSVNYEDHYEEGGQTEWSMEAAPVWTRVRDIGVTNYHPVPKTIQEPTVQVRLRFMLYQGITYSGEQTGQSDPAPCFTDHVRDGRNNLHGTLSLRLDDAVYGPYARLGKPWLDCLRHGKTVSGKVRLTLTDMAALRLDRPVQVGASTFLIKNLKADFPLPAWCDVELLRLG